MIRNVRTRKQPRRRLWGYWRLAGGGGGRDPLPPRNRLPRIPFERQFCISRGTPTSYVTFPRLIRDWSAIIKDKYGLMMPHCGTGLIVLELCHSWYRSDWCEGYSLQIILVRDDILSRSWEGALTPPTNRLTIVVVLESAVLSLLALDVFVHVVWMLNGIFDIREILVYGYECESILFIK